MSPKFCKMQFRGPARSGQVLGEFLAFWTGFEKIFLEILPSRLFWRPVVRGWFGDGSGVVRGVVRWFGGVLRGWFGGGSGMVRGWFGGGSGVVRVWFKSRFSRKCVNFSHFDDFGEFHSVYARSENLQFFFTVHTGFRHFPLFRGYGSNGKPHNNFLAVCLRECF